MCRRKFGSSRKATMSEYQRNKMFTILLRLHIKFKTFKTNFLNSALCEDTKNCIQSRRCTWYFRSKILLSLFAVAERKSTRKIGIQFLNWLQRINSIRTYELDLRLAIMEKAVGREARNSCSQVRSTFISP